MTTVDDNVVKILIYTQIIYIYTYIYTDSCTSILGSHMNQMYDNGNGTDE